MANKDQIAALVNSFGSSVLSVGREVGLTVTLNKAKVSQGIKVADVCAAAMIGIVGAGTRGKIMIMLDKGGFESVVFTMSGGMIAPSLSDAISLSVVGELSNMVSGRALIQSSLTGMDVTPPQMVVDGVQALAAEQPGARSFTLPFSIQPSGVLYLVLTFGGA